MIRITKKFDFEAGHALYGYDGKCKNLHGHSYKLLVTVIGTPINDPHNVKNGMVIDFGDLKRIVQEQIITPFDHAMVFNSNSPHQELAESLRAKGHNIISVPYQPTSENLVIDFAQRIQQQLPPNVQLYSIRLCETESSYAEWFASDNPQPVCTLPDVDGYIFDLDGVLVDTAKYHYLAWKEIAKEFGFELTPEHNEQLKGIGREVSLHKILSWAGKSLSEEVFAQTALRKNESYLQKISHIDHKELLPGVLPLLQQLKSKGKKIALGSASRNARLVLERTGILPYFDAIVDGTMVSKAKPDPEVFLKAAEALHLSANRCCVLEDAPAGIQAAKAAGMTAIGVGSPEILKGADKIISSLTNG